MEHRVWRDATMVRPEDGVKVLLATVTKTGRQNIVLGYFDESCGRWVSGMNANVTHWMPLPEFPVLEADVYEYAIDYYNHFDKWKTAVYRDKWSAESAKVYFETMKIEHTPIYRRKKAEEE